MTQKYTQQDVLTYLKNFVSDCGSRAEAARRMEITPPYLGDLLLGRREISDTIAHKIGFKRIQMSEEWFEKAEA